MPFAFRPNIIPVEMSVCRSVY